MVPKRKFISGKQSSTRFHAYANSFPKPEFLEKKFVLSRKHSRIKNFSETLIKSGLEELPEKQKSFLPGIPGNPSRIFVG